MEIMVMHAHKLKWIALGILAATVALAWGVLQYIAGKAEERLIDTLSESGLQHRVHWQGLSASFGSVTLSDVRFDLESGSDVSLQADRVKISDLNNTEERQRITLEVEGLTVGMGSAHEPVLKDLMGLPSGKADLPPLDTRIAVDVRYDQDEAHAAFTLKQKEGLDVDADVQLTGIGVLRDLTRLVANGVNLPKERVAQNPFGFDARSMGRAPGLPDLTALHVKALEVTLKERGMVKRSVALYKRYNIPLDAAGGSIKSQQNKAFDQMIQDQQAACQRTELAFLRTKDIDKTCRAIVRFLSNDQDTLRASIKPKTPVPLVQLPLIQSVAAFLVPGAGRPLSAQALNFEVDNP